MGINQFNIVNGNTTGIGLHLLYIFQTHSQILDTKTKPVQQTGEELLVLLER